LAGANEQHLGLNRRPGHILEHRVFLGVHFAVNPAIQKAGPKVIKDFIDRAVVNFGTSRMRYHARQRLACRRLEQWNTRMFKAAARWEDNVSKVSLADWQKAIKATPIPRITSKHFPKESGK